MVEVHKHGTRWIIVKNLRAVQGDVPTGQSEASPPQYVFERCWTGDHWDTTINRALAFDSRADAEQYLARHHEM